MHRLILLVPAVLPALLSAQTPVELVALSDNTPAQIVRIDSSCSFTRCPTLMTAVANPALGGTAYDARIGAVWVSNGPLIQAVDAETCAIRCPPHALPFPALAQITGLAVNEAAAVMIVTDTGDNISQWKLSCPITTELTRCHVMLPPGFALSGIGSHDVRDLVVYSAASFGPVVVPGSFVVIARRADPCTPICRFGVSSDCAGNPIGPVTGVAVDPCSDSIYVTAHSPSSGGPIVLCIKFDFDTCTVLGTTCCDPGFPNDFVGLCVKPSQATSTGPSCTNLGCPNCPTMRHVTIGDPALGNANFALDLINAPSGAAVSMFLGAGPCTPPGFSVFPFCGSLLVPVFPIPPIVINAVTGGFGGCTGSVHIPAPIPLDPAFCGGVLSSQYVGVCATALIGTLMSNCQSWMITGT